jgi:hypothetical protein
MGYYLPWASLGLLLISFLSCDAYFIAADCNDKQRADITTAMTGFLNMAAYAIGRSLDQNIAHRQGNLLQAMLGSATENDENILTDIQSECSNFLTIVLPFGLM